MAFCEERTECKDGTIFFDVTDHDLEGYNKFVPYYLHPESVYSVGLSKSSFRVKVSVGSNPWAPQEPEVNLARSANATAVAGTRAWERSHST